MKKYIRVSGIAFLLMFAAVASPLNALAFQPGSLLDPATLLAAPDDAYVVGTRALDQQHWSEAVTAFDEVIRAKSARADAALYWKAYSLNKLGNGPLALATCYQLRSQYGESKWNKDCGAMAISLRVEPQVNVHIPPIVMPDVQVFEDQSYARGSDEDLKILALNSLLHQEPSRAVPMIRTILSGNQSAALKRQALFVLAQNKSPEAQSLLRDAVLGKIAPDVQRQAIQSMAVFQGKKANDTLVEVYRGTSDAKVKRSIISALFITHDAPRMVELAQSEKDLGLKRSLVSQLAMMNDKAATDYMMDLLK
jgi:hypothetical protein